MAVGYIFTLSDLLLSKILLLNPAVEWAAMTALPHAAIMWAGRRTCELSSGNRHNNPQVCQKIKSVLAHYLLQFVEQQQQ